MPKTRTYLLDTHTIIWWFSGDSRLSESCASLLESSENQLFLSSASLHEFAIKDSLGRMPFSTTELVANCKKFGIELLTFDWQSAEVLRTLPLLHKDPFDRALIAQAISANMTLVTGDTQIEKYKDLGMRLFPTSRAV